MKVARFKEKIGEKVGSEVEIFRDRKSKNFQIEKIWERKFWKFTAEIINIFENFEKKLHFNSKNFKIPISKISELNFWSRNFLISLSTFSLIFF